MSITHRIGLKLCKQRLPILACILLLGSPTLIAAPVRVLHKEGVTHGFLLLRDSQAKVLAEGEMIQEPRGRRFYSQLIFHFHDGSLYDDETAYTEGRTFRLVSDHLVEKGPSFKEQMETWLDVPKGEFKARSVDEHGKVKFVSKTLKLPNDVMNGMVYLVVKNIAPMAKSTTVSMVVGTPSPRIVKLVITPHAGDAFYIGDLRREEQHYVIHIDIGGVAGVVAPLVGKQPPDENMWISAGQVPTFLREQGELYNGGPIWTIVLVGPEWKPLDKQQGSDARGAAAVKQKKNNHD